MAGGSGLASAAVLASAILASAILVVVDSTTPDADHHHGRRSIVSDPNDQNGGESIKPYKMELTIKDGKVRGSVVRVRDRDIVSFLAIPYAEKPEKELRFAPPVPVRPWATVRPALQDGNDCFSIRDDMFQDFPGSDMWNGKAPFAEDCLFVNVWAPLNAQNLSVMVWIFGGGFFSGSPSLSLYDGAVMAAEGNVVVVNVNYRLGPFGFLYMGPNSTAKGNVGLMDQQLALQWVQDNVRYFGGEPSQVTIFGESAGAASVSCHLLAPDSWPLFRYAVLQSGSLTAPWATKTPEQARRASEQLLRSVHCYNEDVEESLNCLRGVPAAAVQQAAKNMSDFAGFLQLHFVPVDEDQHFFKGNVFRELAAGNHKRTSVIVGVNVDEGSFWLPYYLSEYFDNVKEGLINRTQYWSSIQKVLPEEAPLVQQATAFQYFPGSRTPSDIEYRDAVSKIASDYHFACTTLDFADTLSRTGSVVYMYYFKERSSVNVWPLWMGVMHGYEIEYVFGAPLRPTQRGYTPHEQEFSRHVIQYWTNFAKHGKPTLNERSGDGGDHTHQRWPDYGPHKNYFILKSAHNRHHSSLVGQNLNHADCAYWRNALRSCKGNNQGHITSIRPSSPGSIFDPSSRAAGGGRPIASSLQFLFVICLCIIASKFWLRSSDS